MLHVLSKINSGGEDMKKKLISVVAMLGVALTLLVGCACKADGCNEEAVKDGYCELHYGLNELGNAVKDLFG